jgi:hypothetical protein
MRSPTEIKRLEREALAEYIRDLYTSIPEDPITVLEVELERAIWRDIEEAEKELAIG